jgi:endonuclease YncB( thermonuclease family)
MPLPALLICLIVGVTDGDTITARCEMPRGMQTFKVRLAEIDAPEKAQPFGNRSKQALSELCFKKQALVHHQDTDRYGRLVARVECDGIDANASMVYSGMAWVYDRYATDETLYEYQEEAQSERRGLWSRNDPVEPWLWRRGLR